MNKQELQFLLSKYNARPRHEQGQNFLIDDQVISDTIRAAELTTEDTALEIGPGFGVLTTALAAHAGKVITVEQDRDIFPAVQDIAKANPNIQPFNTPIQQFNLAEAELQDQKYKLVANLPYNITSWVLRQFVEHKPRPSMMVVMVQKEVAERVTAQPGQLSVLGVAMQLYTEPKIVRLVDKTSFHPQPKVQSAILKLNIRTTPRVPEPEKLMRLVKIGFSAKRKKLQNNLKAGLQVSQENIQQAMQEAGLSETARAQELSIEEWNQLHSSLKV